MCVSMRLAELITVCFNEHGLGNKNNGCLLHVCVCVCVSLKAVTGVCETTADNNSHPLVQVRLNDGELSRGRLCTSETR